MKFLEKGAEEIRSSQDVLDSLTAEASRSDEELKALQPLQEKEDVPIELHQYFLAGYPLVWIRTDEDHRATRLIKDSMAKVASLNKNGIYGEFKYTTGLQVSRPGSTELLQKSEAQDPAQALQYIENKVKTKDDPPVLLVLHNVNPAFKVPMFIQRLKDTYYYARLFGCHVVLVGAQIDIPPELRSFITVYDLNLPSAELFASMFTQISTIYKDKMHEDADRSKERVQLLASSAVGMTEMQGENAVALSVVVKKSLDPRIVQVEKEQAIKRGDVLEYVRADAGIVDLGGWENYKLWLELRKEDLSPEAVAYGLRFPKGALVAGIPGCGKSLAAKATASYLQLPLLKFDVGRVFRSLQGQSEALTREVTKTVEAVAPVVLWIEEIEKSTAGLESSGKTDSGTTARIMSTILTWMQETTYPIFFYATCNNVHTMPPEMYRKGRFSSMWGVVEPNEHGREEIWKIKIKKARPKTYLDYDYKRLVAASRMYTGAEIELAVDDAMHVAFRDKRREFTTDDLCHAIEEMVPQHKTSKDKIDRTRAWMKERVDMVEGEGVSTAEEKDVERGWDDIDKKVRKLGDTTSDGESIN